MKSSVLISRIYSKGAITRIRNKILSLGSNCKIDINVYLNVKSFLLLGVFVFTLLYYDKGYAIAPGVVILLYYLYDYLLLDIKIKERTRVLEKDAIFFFEVLALTLQSEKNLKNCIETTCDVIDSDLSTEFKEVIKEVKLGKSLTEALTDAKKRIPSKAVNNVLLNIIESNVYGTSIIGALENQIEYLTDSRILEIKGQINKLPTKISIASVLFFIPIMMLLILGPLLINYFVK